MCNMKEFDEAVQRVQAIGHRMLSDVKYWKEDAMRYGTVSRDGFVANRDNRECEKCTSWWAQKCEAEDERDNAVVRLAEVTKERDGFRAERDEAKIAFSALRSDYAKLNDRLRFVATQWTLDHEEREKQCPTSKR